MKMQRTIVVSALAATAACALWACGQKGDLYLPTEPEAAQRATLPQTLLPAAGRTAHRPDTAAASAASPASAAP